MNVKLVPLVLTAFLLSMNTPAEAQELMIYPAKGQSSDQMEKDKYECYTWAKGQTGFDPMKQPTASSPPPSQEKKSVGGAAVVGGALGAVGGAIIGGATGGSAGTGAAIGALSGGAIGGIRSSSQNKKSEQQRKQWEQEQANQYAQKRHSYNRAYSACLEGRGYTVK